MSAILNAFACRYRDSKGGRTGRPVRDFGIDYRELLGLAGAEDGEAREVAEQELIAAAACSGGLLILDHALREPSNFTRVRLSREGGEGWLFHYLGLTPPEDHRRMLAEVFAMASREPVPALWQEPWRRWCLGLESAVVTGLGMAPFSRTDIKGNQELLRVLRRLLAWPGESLIRFASCVICGDSKTLEGMQPRLEQALKQISVKGMTSLSELGLIEAPRQVLLHGPLRLALPRGLMDLELLSGPVRVSETDIALATSIVSTAPCCLSVENETTFHELAKLNSGVLLVQTSYPGRGVRKLFERLASDLPLWHFGDSDPAGFDILRDLRTRTGRSIRALHMRFQTGDGGEPLSSQEGRMLDRLAADPAMSDVRGELLAMKQAGHKGQYEQESLGWPRASWPFYAR